MSVHVCKKKHFETPDYIDRRTNNSVYDLPHLLLQINGVCREGIRSRDPVLTVRQTSVWELQSDSLSLPLM